MKAQVLPGSKQEIARKVLELEGEICEAIVFIDEPTPPSESATDIFTEMDPFTVQQANVDDSRDAVYQLGEDE